MVIGASVSRPEGKVSALSAIAAVVLVIGISVLAPGHLERAKADVDQNGHNWFGTWGAAPQRGIPGHLQTLRNQTLRLIVHTSASGTNVRIRISNTFGDQPLLIGAAHIAQRAAGADIDPASDRVLTFRRRASIKVAAGAMVVSDPVDLEVPALSDLSVSLFFANATSVKTSHRLALQTSYVSA